MSESIRLRKARAVYAHAGRTVQRLTSAGMGSDRQDVDDAELALDLAALDLEAAQAGKRQPTELESRADDLFMRIGRVVVLGGELEGLLIAWRKDLQEQTEESHEAPS